ncbi:MAG: GerMN domain-containing protein [Bacillota bacterium]|nr:GerMN domain-containing protein [Bacillota bacterium]MDW7682822.1 GerMN domain-containing protein [Bacillota bacterium]
MKKWFILMLVLSLTVVLMVGCTSNTAPQQRPQDQQSEPGESKEMTFTLYYGDKEIMELIAEERTVSVPAEKDPLQAAVEELANEPVSPEAVVLMPLETEILGVSVADGIITIDFNEKLRDNFYGGSSSEDFLIRSIVDTVTSLEGYNDHKVAFLINGEQFETIGGHISAEELFERSQ